LTRRGEWTDEAWVRLAPLLPENGRRGKQRKDHRKDLNGILWRMGTGAPWRDLPSRYGPWQTCYERWRRDGTWDRLLAHAQMKCDAASEVVGEVSVDSTISRAPRKSSELRPGRLPKAQRGGAVRKPAKTWRGIATRYEKRASNYRAIVVIAALMIWLRS